MSRAKATSVRTDAATVIVERLMVLPSGGCAFKLKHLWYGVNARDGFEMRGQCKWRVHLRRTIRTSPAG